MPPFPVITSLNAIPTLWNEHVADLAYMPDFDGVNVYQWDAIAGSLPASCVYAGDGDGPPQYVMDAFGTGRHAVQFVGGKMTGEWFASAADMTCAFVGNHDAWNSYAPYPRFVSAAHYGVGSEDWDAPETWVLSCYDSSIGCFVADRNWARPLTLPFVTGTNYIAVTRKQGGTITAWLQPFGGNTATASGATGNVGLVFDTLLLGGNGEPQNLAGMIAHVGLWGRGLADSEVLSVMNYLGSRYA